MLQLPLPISPHHLCYHLNHPPDLVCEKKCVPWHQSLMPKRLGTAVLEDHSEGIAGLQWVKLMVLRNGVWETVGAVFEWYFLFFIPDIFLSSLGRPWPVYVVGNTVGSLYLCSRFHILGSNPPKVENIQKRKGERMGKHLKRSQWIFLNQQNILRHRFES